MSLDFNWPAVVFSGDIDWASEACIQDAYEFAAERGIKPSFFVTHESAVLKALGDACKVELGLHPNFLPNSSHGEAQDEVIENVTRLLPAARGFRSHCFVDSTPIARRFKECGFVWDSNLCLFLQDRIMPLRHCSGLIRFPVFWADDVHMAHRPDDWDIEAVLERFLSPGLKILDVHPIHLALNTPDVNFYAHHKARAKSLSADEIISLRHKGLGVRMFLDALIRRLQSADVQFYNFEQILELTDNSGNAVSQIEAGRNDRLSAEGYSSYWSASAAERQAMLRDIYNQRNPADPYSTSRDHNQRELEISAIRKALPDGSLKTIVDLGCGNGHTLLSIGKDFAGAHLVGVDFADRLIEGARHLTSNARTELKSRPEFICGDAIEYTKRLSSNSIDCVITERFLLNLPDQELQHAEIREIFRVLRPGGRFLMCEGSLDGFHALNRLRVSVGLAEIAETSTENVSSRRFVDAAIEHFVVDDVGFELIDKLGFSAFFAVSRALYPKLIEPQKPRFDAHINAIARQIQESIPMSPGLGSNVLWVLDKPIATA